MAMGIEVDIKVDKKNVDLMMRSIEMTLMGSSLFMFLRDYMQPYMRARVARRFAGEGDDASGSWEPLADATHDFRERQGFAPDHPINHRTGELEAFMRSGNIDLQMAPNTAAMFFPGTPPSQSLKEKLKTAQQGRSRSRNFLGLGETPARPVAAVSVADMSYFLQSFAFWFGREMRTHLAGGFGLSG